MKEVNTDNLWTFELGTQESVNVPIMLLLGFNKKKDKAQKN